MYTNETFTARSNEVHGSQYDYSRVNYVNAHTPVELICSIHGSFFIRPANHINQKQGCRQCGLKKRRLPHRKTTEQFIQAATTKWGGLNDYTNTVYVNKSTKVTFHCLEHGPVQQMPYLHLKHGCPYCSGRGEPKHTLETFVTKANQVHSNRYDYSLVSFKSVHDKVKIICPAHGIFEQKAANHINLGNGCPKCNGGVGIGHADYLKRAKERHGDKFEYPAEYDKAHKKITIRCPLHGDFEQLAYMHLQTDVACPHCVASLTSSAEEGELRSYIAEMYCGDLRANDRNILDGQEIDIYLPDLKVGIEYHGEFWHTERTLGRNYHYNKANVASSKQVRLIQVFGHEWHDKREIVKSRIANLLGRSHRIFARETTVEVLVPLDKNRFLERTHIQGQDNASLSLGLIHKGDLVACMTFGRPRFSKECNYELIRYASELGNAVVGGASKLLKYFRSKYSGSIISYADRRWSTGGLYETLGFKFSGNTSPGFFYYHTKNKSILSRLSCQKHKLKKMPFYEESLSASQIMSLNGYERIWDAGHSRWVLK